MPDLIVWQGSQFETKKPGFSKKVLIFENRTIPKLAKTKSLENSVFCRALVTKSTKIDEIFISLKSKSLKYKRLINWQGSQNNINALFTWRQ